MTSVTVTIAVHMLIQSVFFMTLLCLLTQYYSEPSSHDHSFFFPFPASDVRVKSKVSSPHKEERSPICI